MAVVYLNAGCTALNALIERIEHDPWPLTRSHALWAIAQLDQKKASSVVERDHSSTLIRLSASKHAC